MCKISNENRSAMPTVIIMPMSTSTGAELFHTCLECGHAYKDPADAQACEEYCMKNHKVSREIAARSAQ